MIQSNIKRRNPTVRPVEAATLLRWPKRLKSKTGWVTVPEKEEPPREETQREPVAHTEIQWRFAKLGCDTGMDVWVARNNRGRQWADHHFTELSHLRSDLPVQFDEATIAGWIMLFSELLAAMKPQLRKSFSKRLQQDNITFDKVRKRLTGPRHDFWT